ncbi:MAG: U32 family peptidase [Candidatus Cloacimonetes bacterium]|nr:U32 family peptidase [Candidatus Cloacimonadota bacterium]
MSKVRKLELLAPAGNLDKLKSAVLYGADAVYLSNRFFGLRGKAGNFTLNQMKEGVEFAHARGVKVYAAVNIFAYNRDFRRLAEYLKILQDEIHIDAIIVTDPGVIDLAKEVAPKLELHLSTQANTLNYRACSFWKKQGVSRVILAREVSFKDIKKICAEDIVDIEIFVHGSICIAYSGRCFISNYMSKYRDANRGLCTNSCRWNYSLQGKVGEGTTCSTHGSDTSACSNPTDETTQVPATESEFKEHAKDLATSNEFQVEEAERPGEYMPLEEDGRGTYLFNSKDLSLINRLDDIIESGLVSLKVEGRTKSVSYVSCITAIYRKALDAYYSSKEDYYKILPDLNMELAQIGGRGYTEGLFKGDHQDDYNYHENLALQHSYDLAGYVRKDHETEKLKHVSIKQKLIVGQEVQIFRRDLNHEFRTIKEIYKLDGTKVERVVGGDEAYLSGFDDLEEGTILRIGSKLARKE